MRRPIRRAAAFLLAVALVFIPYASAHPASHSGYLDTAILSHYYYISETNNYTELSDIEWSVTEAYHNTSNSTDYRRQFGC